jgi:tape measure domain-containing protein
LGAKEVLAYTQAWTKAQNALKTAGVANDQVAGTLDRVFQIAQRQGTALGPLVSLYGKVKQAAGELGASEAQTTQFTEGVALALRVAGTSSEQASGALLQLSQLLGSGVVHAEEFNSVMEGARPILQAVASGLEEAGGSVAKLRTLVNAGKVTSAEFFGAFLRGMGELQDKASRATDTVGQALTRVNNALIRYVGSTDAALSITTRISTGLSELAKHFDLVADAVLLLGTAFATALIARGLTPMTTALLSSVAAMRTAVVGVNGLQVAIVAAAARAQAGALALRGFAAASSLFGGPVGLALAGLALAFSIATIRTAEAEDKAKRYAAALDRVQSSAAGAGTASKDAANQFVATETNRLTLQLKADAREIATVAAEINASLDRAIGGANLHFRGRDNPITDALKGVKSGLGDTAQSALATKDKLYELANSNPQFQQLANRLAPLLDTLAGVRAAVEEAKRAVDSLAADSADAKLRAMLGKPPSYEDASRAALNDPTLRAAQTQGYIREQTRLYRMSADARKIQTEAEKIYNDAIAKGTELTKEQAKGIATFIVNAEKADKVEHDRAEKAKQFQKTLKSYDLNTDEIRLEAQLVGKSTFEATKQAEALRLVNQAKAEGIRITDTVLRQIDEEATKRANATVALQRAQEEHQRLIDLQQQLGDLGVSSLEGLIEGTKTWTDVLNDALKMLIRMVLQAAILGQGPLGNMFGFGASGGGIGGLLGGLFKFFGFAEGGYVRGPGTGRSDSIPARLSDGEYVVNARATAKHRRLLEAINKDDVPAEQRRGVRRLASGGYVSQAPNIVPRIPAPSMPDLHIAGASVISAPTTVNYAPAISVKVEGSAGTPQQNQDLADKVSRAISEHLDARMTAAISSQMRPGGLLQNVNKR